MAPSRRQSNGRSPLVNQQRQITTFFNKKNTDSESTPSPSPSLSKQNPSPNGTSSPTTPSPLQSKPKKPLLVIGRSPLTPGGVKSYGEGVVRKRIRVYWPLDKAWYEGVVKSYDKSSGKHLVQYDDAEEEVLDLEKEKIEWIDVEVKGKKKLKRLRRGPMFEKASVKEEKEVVEDLEDSDGCGDNGVDDGEDDDSSDEDWGKNAEKEAVEDQEEEECVDLEDEEMIDDEGVVGKSKGKGAGRNDSKKRKASPGVRGSAKKSKSCGNAGKGGLKTSSPEPLRNSESK